MPGRLSRTDESVVIVIREEPGANAMNTSLLMKLYDASERDAGASSTLMKLIAGWVFSASTSNCVNAPSPDQPVASSSI